MAKQNRKEVTAFENKLYTGIFLGTVRGYVNPTKSQLGEMKGYTPSDEAKEPEYEFKDKENNEGVRISFHVQADAPELDNPWFNLKFGLVDKPVFTKEAEGKVTRQQWVNQCGGDFGSTYVDSKDNLPSWFTEYQDKDKNKLAAKIHRPAIAGEADLNKFLATWWEYVDFRYNKNDEQQSSVLVDVKRLFRNVNKFVADEYQPLIDVQNEIDRLSAEIERVTEEVAPVNSSEDPEVVKSYAIAYTENKKNILTKLQHQKNRLEGKVKGDIADAIMVGSVVFLATVHTGEDKDGNIIHYQNVYNLFMPARMMPHIKTAITTGNWSSKDKYVDKALKNYHKTLTGEYGPKDAFTLTLLQEFNPDEHIQSGNETFKGPEGGNTADVSDTSY